MDSGDCAQDIVDVFRSLWLKDHRIDSIEDADVESFAGTPWHIDGHMFTLYSNCSRWTYTYKSNSLIPTRSPNYDGMPIHDE